MDKNKEEETKLRKDKRNLEVSLNAKIQQYDEEMSSKVKILEELQQNYDKELVEYQHLKEHFDKIDADIAGNATEDTILNAVKRKIAFGYYVVTRAAVKIQSLYRGNKGRAYALKIKAKKAKKNKKKGKKSPKKK